MWQLMEWFTTLNVGYFTKNAIDSADFSFFLWKHISIHVIDHINNKMYWVASQLISLVHNQIWYPKFWLPKLVTSGHRLTKLVANISSQFCHLVNSNTGLAVGSLVKWLPIKVANPYKLRQIWVVYCSPIENGFIRLQSPLTHYALWNFSSNGVGHFSELVGAHT